MIQMKKTKSETTPVCFIDYMLITHAASHVYTIERVFDQSTFSNSGTSFILKDTSRSGRCELFLISLEFDMFPVYISICFVYFKSPFFGPIDPETV